MDDNMIYIVYYFSVNNNIDIWLSANACFNMFDNIQTKLLIKFQITCLELHASVCLLEIAA